MAAAFMPCAPGCVGLKRLSTGWEGTRFMLPSIAEPPLRFTPAYSAGTGWPPRCASAPTKRWNSFPIRDSIEIAIEK